MLSTNLRIRFFTNFTTNQIVFDAENKQENLFNVVGMSKEKLFDMWQNYEFLKYYVIFIFFKQLSLPCLTVSVLYFKKKFRNMFREYLKIRNFVTYQITFLLTCQPQKKDSLLVPPLHLPDFLIFCRLWHVKQIWDKFKWLSKFKFQNIFVVLLRKIVYS